MLRKIKKFLFGERPLRDRFVLRLQALAESYLQHLFPWGYAGEIFLCGGAFKPLLKDGLSICDLDLWVRDRKERLLLASSLEERGAKLVRDFHPYCMKYKLDDLVIEINYHNVKSSTLLSLFSNCDLALCAMGAHYKDGRVVDVVVHDDCWRAISDQEVRIHGNHLNYLLETRTTSVLRCLHRMRRQSAELGYRINVDHEHRLWGMFFQDFSSEERQACMDLYLSTMVDYKGQIDEEIIATATQTAIPSPARSWQLHGTTRKISRWLKEADYLRCHLALRRWSNEWSAIQEHVDQTGFFRIIENPLPHALSVGCGSGEMDAPWLMEMDEKTELATYTALDPNRKSIDAFEQNLRPKLSGKHTTLHCVTEKYEDYSPPASLDRIMFMHSLYHFEDREAILRKAITELSPDGKIMICVSDDDGLSRYKAAVYQRIEMPAESQHSPGTDLRGILSRIDLPFSLSQTFAEIDVTECLLLTPDGIALLDFFFLCRFEALHEDQRAAVLAELPKHCEKRNDRFILRQTILFALLWKRENGSGSEQRQMTPPLSIQKSNLDISSNIVSMHS